MIYRKFKTINKSKNKIRICTYNILAQVLLEVSNEAKTSCNKKCINWKNRFDNILNEIIYYNIDIVCLQEVQNDLFYKEMNIKFMKNGYYGLFVPQKLFSKKFYNSNQNIGISIFFKRDKFNLLSFKSFDNYKYTKRFLKKNRLENFSEKIKKRFVGLITFFEDKKTKFVFCFNNIYLESNPLYEDIKNLQVYILLKHLYSITNKGNIPIILCGDFNSQPTSSTYQSISTGISLNKFNLENFKYPKPFIKTPYIYTKIPFKSVYKEVFGKEPKYTNYTETFKNTLDYIFVNNKIKILSALQEINKKYYSKIISLPNNDIPSDHIIQISDIEILKN